MRIVAALAALGVASLLSACGSCSRGGVPPGTLDGAPSPRTSLPPDAGPVAVRDLALWNHAVDGGAEDLATLAAHEGAPGLVEGAGEPALRVTALRAMAFARGWAHLPFLAKTASGDKQDEALIALESIVELAARPRRPEDPEDADELAEGCEVLGTLARSKEAEKARRVQAIRALRMMTCPAFDGGGALPTDLDAK